jgi:hypothetical protein
VKGKSGFRREGFDGGHPGRNGIILIADTAYFGNLDAAQSQDVNVTGAGRFLDGD